MLSLTNTVKMLAVIAVGPSTLSMASAAPAQPTADCASGCCSAPAAAMPCCQSTPTALQPYQTSLDVRNLAPKQDLYSFYVAVRDTAGNPVDNARVSLRPSWSMVPTIRLRRDRGGQYFANARYSGDPRRDLVVVVEPQQ